MKPLRLTNLYFLTSAGNKMHLLVRKSSLVRRKSLMTPALVSAPNGNITTKLTRHVTFMAVTLLYSASVPSISTLCRLHKYQSFYSTAAIAL